MVPYLLAAQHSLGAAQDDRDLQQSSSERTLGGSAHCALAARQGRAVRILSKRFKLAHNVSDEPGPLPARCDQRG
jgi:hypothetical protein